MQTVNDSLALDYQYPDHWNVRELGSFCDISSGGTPRRSKQQYFNGVIPWAKIGDMANWIICETEEKITKSGLENSAAKIFPKGTVLISIFATIGTVSMLGIEAATNQAIAGVIPDPTIADNRYLAYYLASLKPKLEAISRGVAQRNINQTILKSVRIPLPSLKEQYAIADVLDRTRALREKREQANQLTNEIIQSVFLKMFGDIAANNGNWESSPASEIFDMQLGKPLSAKEYTGKHLKPYLRNVNVQWGHLDLSDIKEMDFDDEEFPKYQLRKGDILVCEGGEVGRTAIYGGEIQNCCYQKALHRLRIRQPVITSEYFVYYMQLAAKYGLLLRETSQVTIAHFTAEKFRKVRILLPPISIQNQFAAFVEKAKSIRANQKQSTEEINELFQSLMHKAFRGELAGA